MRILAVFTTAGLLLTASPALGRFVDVSPQTEDELRKKCTDNGGTFDKEGGAYWCSKACKGGICHVYCPGEGQKCTGSVPPKKRESQPRQVEDVLTDRLGGDDGGGEGFPPWIGLVGLLGLAGLVRRSRTNSHAQEGTQGR
jgi:hypothetical protein